MNGKIWIYLSDKPIEGDLQTSIEKDCADFILDWNAHGAKLDASFKILHNRFIVFSVNESMFAASGCSIDKQVQFVKSLETKYNLSLLNRLLFAYKNADTIEVVHAAKAKQLLREGQITPNTVCFNPSLTSTAHFAAEFEIPVSQSWIYSN